MPKQTGRVSDLGSVGLRRHRVAGQPLERDRGTQEQLLQGEDENIIETRVV
jgi:hypothetical protein